MQLDPDPAEWRALATSVVDYLTGVLRDLPDAPASSFDGVDAVVGDPEIRRPPPETGRPLAELLQVLDRAAGVGLNPSTPGYLAFIPGSGLVSAALAGLIGDVLNRYTGLAFPAPALVALEADLLRWLAGLFDLPATAGGLFTSGGSLATFSALVAARCDRLPPDFLNGTLYVTDQAHLSVIKAARLAGFPAAAVRVVPDDGAQRMDVAALQALVDGDRRAGRAPFSVVANAGTTNTGAIDPLQEILRVCRARGLWAHADGAYGGLFRIARGGDRLLPGLGGFDSLTLDPHKCLFLPYGTGALLMKDPEALRRAHATSASYLQDVTAGESLGITDYSPELSRDFRGIRVWLPFMLHGVAAFRDQLSEKLALTRWAYDELAREPLFEMFDEPQLSVVALAAKPPAGHALDANAFGAEVLKRVNARKRVFLSSTAIGGRYLIRICIVSFRTHADRVREAVEGLVAEARALATEG